MLAPSITIYDASAGSGKTHTLVKEYLKIVLSAERNDAYKNILAITFTNKAVHEMKSRVVETLFEFSKSEPAEKAKLMLSELAKEIGISEVQLKEKAASVIRHLIHNYAAFDISTIDKFTHRVIRTFARDLNLPSSFEVSLDSDSLLTEAVDALISKAGELKGLTDLLVDFTLEKADDDKSWDVSRDISNKGKLLFQEVHKQEIEKFSNIQIPEFIEAKRKIKEAVGGISQSIADLAKSALKLIEDNGLEHSNFFHSYVPKHFVKVASGIIEKHDTNYKYLNGESSRYSKNVPQDQKDIIDRIAPELLHYYQEINNQVSKYLLYFAYLKNLTPLSVLNSLDYEIKRIQDEQNMLSISEFNAIIHKQIQGQPAPFIYERMGERYRHFFIDEFQDTSEMQWQNLIPLIDNSLAGQDDFGQKGTLMIVGDPKQSIYRWRGGKAEQFISLSKGNIPFSNPEMETKSLGTNWRSYSQVIDFNNQFFGYLSDRFENEDYRDLYKNKSSQKIANKIGGFVNLTFVDSELEEDDVYAVAVLHRINSLLDLGFSLSEIAILTRTRAQGISVAAYLTENNIPIISSETLRIDASVSVRFLVDILRYLYQPTNKECKARWLYFIGNSHEVNQLSDFISKGLSFKSDIELGKWLSEIGVNLVFSDLRKKSLYEATEYLATQLLPKNDAYIQYFLDVVLEREIQYQSGLGNFLQYWDEHSQKFSVPSPDGADAVKIMTIHKSKGLEFPVVIYPYAEQDLSRIRDEVWVPVGEEFEGLPDLLTEVSSNMKNLGEEAEGIFQVKSQEHLLDIINVLYVVLTRAEEQLYVISTVKLTSKGELVKNNLSTFFVDFLSDLGVYEASKLSYDFGSNKKLSSPKLLTEKMLAVTKVDHPLKMEQIKIAQRESLMWGSKQMDAIAYGNTLHEILSFINTKEDIEKAIERAIRIGLITPLIQDSIRATLNEICSNVELLPFFDERNQILKEQTIIDNRAKTIKPDRIAITENNEVFLLDYKTGAHDPKYTIQVEEYAAALTEMGYSVVKKILLYTGSPIKIIAL